MSNREAACYDFPSLILRGLYVGSKKNASQRAQLEKLGIVRILNATPSREEDPRMGVPNYFEREKGSGGPIKYLRISVMDNQGESVREFLDKAADWISQGLHYGSVLIHCHQGVCRSVTFCTAFLMKYRGLGVDGSLRYLKRRRPCSNINKSFVSQLRDYEKQLKEERLQAIDRKEPAPSYPQDLIDMPSEQCQRPLQRSIGPQGPQRPPGLQDSHQSLRPQGPQRPPGPQVPQQSLRSLGPQPKSKPERADVDADADHLQTPAKRPLEPIGPSLPISQTPSEDISSGSSKQLGNRKQRVV
eukprot:282265_1